MNPELQAKLVHYLDVLEKGAQKAGDFAEAEIPQLVREWLIWLAIERFGYAIMFLVACVALQWAFRVLFRSAKYYTAQDDDVLVPCWFGSVLTAIAFTVCAFQAFDWTLSGVKVLVAPRVVVVEKLAETVKHMK